MGPTRSLGVMLVVGAALGGWPGPGAAQITLDGTIRAGAPSGPLVGPNFVIPAEAGATQGNNLFHSFGQFNVRTNESATFTGPASIQNVISRVTGGSQSFIDGLIDSRTYMPGANFYLLNPSGVLFGPNARLDVGGAFHVSTADALKLTDPGIVYADPARPTVLTVAAPEAFGFLQERPAGITVDRSRLAVSAGQTLSMVGGDLQIGGATLLAPSGRIDLTSVASPGEVLLPSASRPAVDPVSRFGAVRISGSLLSTSPAAPTVAPGGTIAIRGGQIVVERSNLNLFGNPGGMLIVAGEQLALDQTFVNTGTRGTAHHPGTAVDIQVTGAMTMTNGSEIASSSFQTGRAGGVRIVAGEMTLGDDDPSTSAFSSIGFYGDIGSRAFGFGRGGDVEITTGSLVVKNGFFINTAALSGGDAGHVTIRADRLVILDGASISSNGFGLGRGGTVDVIVPEVLISAANINSFNCPCFTGIAAQTGFGSPGGLLRLTTDTLTLLDGGRISTVLFSIGPGADIEITARSIVISGVVLQATASPPDVHAGIDARVFGGFATGVGGAIRITTDSLSVSDGGIISSSLFAGAPGTAGNIVVRAGQVDIRDRSFIAASSLFGSGAAGRIEIVADTLAITGVADSNDPFNTDFTGVSTTTGPTGRSGGDIQVVGGTVLVDDKGSIASASLGPGAAGTIRIDADRVSVTDGGAVVASALGSGPGGTIAITAGDVIVAGAGRFLGAMDAGVSAIASQTGVGGGPAGDVRITADRLQVLDGAKVTTETFGPGPGGSIVVDAGSVIVSGVNEPLLASLGALPGADPTLASAAITANSNRFFLGDAATGNAGSVRIVAGTIVVTGAGVISSGTDTPGAGGTISLTADRLVISGGAQILSSTESPGTGPGGDITATAREILIDNATISARSTGGATALAGDVTILFGERLVMRGATLSTEAAVADGGNISITSLGSLLQLTDSRITTSVQSGLGAGGNITIGSALNPIDFVVLNRSQIRADAFGGPGGNVRIAADVFLTSGSLVSASSALGVPGTIDIQARITDVSGSLADLPEAVLAAAALLRASCAVRLAEGQSSSLVVAGREGLPPEPGGLLPSYVAETRPVAVGLYGVPAPGWEELRGALRVLLDPPCAR